MKKLIYGLVAAVWLFSLMFVTISYALDEKKLIGYIRG